MNKKVRNSLIAVGLLAVVGVGGTFAYLTNKTDSVKNTFTMGTGITGKTTEPKWDEKNAQNFVPGKVIYKDPQITNTSASTTDPVYVAATIQYQMKDADGNWTDTTYAQLDQFINIKSGDSLTDGFNTADWAMAKDNTVAYYTKGTLASQQTTSPIFSAVEIDPLALTPEQVKSAEGGANANVQFDMSKYEVKDAAGNVTSYTYKTYTMGDFQIIVQGYLCQTEGFSSVQNAMQTAFPTIF